MNHIAEAFGEIFCPTPEQIARRREAERRRFAALSFKEKAKEVTFDLLESGGGLILSLFLLALVFGPWFYGAYRLWKRFL